MLRFFLMRKIPCHTTAHRNNANHMKLSTDFVEVRMGALEGEKGDKQKHINFIIVCPDYV